MKIANIINTISYKLNVLFTLASNGAGKYNQNELAPITQSDVNYFIQLIFTLIENVLRAVGDTIVTTLCTIVYFVAKLCLNFVDLFMAFIQQFSSNYSAYSFKELSDITDADMIVSFLFNPVFLKVFKTIIIVAFVLLIIFTIIALVKNEWKSATKGAGRKPMQFIRKMMISLFAFLFVPVLLVVGILASNIVLTSVVNAIKGPDYNNNRSLGQDIFMASTAEANLYRIYADENLKKPILFNYNGGFFDNTTEIVELPENGLSADIDAEMEAILNGTKLNAGYSTFQMFNKNTFYNITDIADESKYYQVYDGPYLKRKQVEYYAMADFLDYALMTNLKFNYVNVEEVYKTCFALYKNPLFKDNESVLDIITRIRIYDLENRLLNVDEIEDLTQLYQKVDHYCFDVYYKDEAVKNDPNYENFVDGKYTYTSYARAKDEAEGAIYLLCTQNNLTYTVPEENTTDNLAPANNYNNSEQDQQLIDDYFIWQPLMQNTVLAEKQFTSSVLKTPVPETEDMIVEDNYPSWFIALGVFDSEGRTTALREDGNMVVCYRHNASTPTAFKVVTKIDYIEDNSVFESGILPGLFEIVTGVDTGTVVPDVKLKIEAATAYGKSVDTAMFFEDGQITVNYNFVETELTIRNVYNLKKLNFFILMFGSFSLFASLFKIALGLIVRVFESLSLILVMPIFISAFPIEDSDGLSSGTRFAKWKDELLERVFSIYGVYIMITLAFTLAPLIFQLDIFGFSGASLTTDNVFGGLSVNALDYVIKVLFLLVLFAMIGNTGEDPKGSQFSSGVNLINNLIFGNPIYTSDSKNGISDTWNITDAGESYTKSVKSTGKAIQEISTGNAIKNKFDALTNGAKRLVPGRAIVNTASQKIADIRANKDMKDRANNLLNSRAVDAAVRANTTNLNADTKNYAKFEKDKQKARNDRNKAEY